MNSALVDERMCLWRSTYRSMLQTCGYTSYILGFFADSFQQEHIEQGVWSWLAEPRAGTRGTGSSCCSSVPSVSAVRVPPLPGEHHCNSPAAHKLGMAHLLWSVVSHVYSQVRDHALSARLSRSHMCSIICIVKGTGSCRRWHATAIFSKCRLVSWSLLSVQPQLPQIVTQRASDGNTSCRGRRWCWTRRAAGGRRTSSS